MIAILLTTLRAYGLPAAYDSMFTANIIWTVLQGLVWFGVFTLIFQFHPWHALGIGLATMLLVTGLATMGVESLMSKAAPAPQAARGTLSNQPVRHSISPTGSRRHAGDRAETEIPVIPPLLGRENGGSCDPRRSTNAIASRRAGKADDFPGERRV